MPRSPWDEEFAVWESLVDQVEESELAGLGDEAAKFFDCLNSEEVIQVLTLPAVVEQ